MHCIFYAYKLISTHIRIEIRLVRRGISYSRSWLYLAEEISSNLEDKWRGRAPRGILGGVLGLWGFNMKSASLIKYEPYRYLKWNVIKGKYPSPAELFTVKKLMRSSTKDNESISCKRNQIVNLWPIFMLLYINIEENLYGKYLLLSPMCPTERFPK